MYKFFLELVLTVNSNNFKIKKFDLETCQNNFSKNKTRPALYIAYSYKL